MKRFSPGTDRFIVIAKELYNYNFQEIKLALGDAHLSTISRIFKKYVTLLSRNEIIQYKKLLDRPDQIVTPILNKITLLIN